MIESNMQRNHQYSLADIKSDACLKAISVQRTSDTPLDASDFSALGRKPKPDRAVSREATVAMKAVQTPDFLEKYITRASLKKNRGWNNYAIGAFLPSPLDFGVGINGKGRVLGFEMETVLQAEKSPAFIEWKAGKGAQKRPFFRSSRISKAVVERAIAQAESRAV